MSSGGVPSYTTMSFSRIAELHNKMAERGIVITEENESKLHLFAKTCESDEWISLRDYRGEENNSKRVWWALLDLADNNLVVSNVEPSLSKALCQELRMKQPNVSRAMKRLQEVGLIECLPRPRGQKEKDWRLCPPSGVVVSVE